MAGIVSLVFCGVLTGTVIPLTRKQQTWMEFISSPNTSQPPSPGEELGFPEA